MKRGLKPSFKRKPIPLIGISNMANGDGGSRKEPALKNPQQELVGVFPLKIWKTISEKMQDPQDLENLSNASPTLRTLLAPRRVLFLFPKVWDILGQKYDQSHETVGVYNETTGDNSPVPGTSTGKKKMNSGVKMARCNSCGRKREAQWYSGILKLRLVSRTWSSAVDKRFQGCARVDEDLCFDDKPAGFTEGGQMDFYVFDESSGEHESFTKHFGQTHGNDPNGRSPFITKEVSIIFGNMDEDDDTRVKASYRKKKARLFEGLSTLLSKFGRHISKCDITTGPEFLALVKDRYLKTIKLLRMMPNLTDLSMSRLSAIMEEQMGLEGPLQKVISKQPAPKLKMLQSLRTWLTFSPEFNALIRANNHISKLEIVQYVCIVDYELKEVQFPNLSKLSVSYQMENHVLGSLRDANWPLKEFELNMQHLPRETKLSQVFNLLSRKWSGTLTSLWIMLPRISSDAFTGPVDENFKKDLINLQLNLPNLKLLKLTMWYILPLDFMLPMKESLEVLDVDIAFYGDGQAFEQKALEVENGKQVKLLNYFDRTLTSDIWRIFKNLELIKFQLGNKESSCSRRDWKLQEKKKLQF